MTLLALASPELCAAALRQPLPTVDDETVRVILDGSAAMGLAVVCGPWDHGAEVDAVCGELDGDGLDGHGPTDTVTSWLVASPGAPAVVGPVSGPLWLAAEVAAGGARDLQDALDAAADVVAERVRALCELGTAHVVVLEAAGGGTVDVDAGAAAEAHTPITRLAHHFGVPVTLAALDDDIPAAALGYQRWASPTAGSGGLSLVTAEALRAGTVSVAGGVGGDVVTEYLLADVDPADVRDVAGAQGAQS